MQKCRNQNCFIQLWRFFLKVKPSDFSHFIWNICIDWSCSVENQESGTVLAKPDGSSCVCKNSLLRHGGALQFLWLHLSCSVRQDKASWAVLKTSGLVHTLSLHSFLPFLPKTVRLCSYCLLELAQGLCSPNKQILLDRTSAGVCWNFTEELSNTTQPLQWPYFIRAIWSAMDWEASGVAVSPKLFWTLRHLTAYKHF